MGKRKRSKEDKYENIMKKIKKLERKVKDRQDLKSDSEISSAHSRDEIFPEDITNVEIPSTPPPEEAPALDQDLLDILGEDLSNDKLLGESIHKDLTSRWKHILLNGLSKDSKSDLLKKYLTPENCLSINPPKLNLEIKAALTEPNKKKDIYSESRQKQVAGCLSAVGKALTLALNQNICTQIIRPLSDAGRLLCDIHFRESLSRRYAIINTISKEERETVKNTKIDDYLFGSDLSEQLKSSKAITRTSKDLRPQPPATGMALKRPTATSFTPRASLNIRGTPRVAAEQRVNPGARRLPQRQPQRQPDQSRQTRPAQFRQRRY